jgi:hypothetical protein
LKRQSNLMTSNFSVCMAGADRSEGVVQIVGWWVGGGQGTWRPALIAPFGSDVRFARIS